MKNELTVAAHNRSTQASVSLRFTTLVECVRVRAHTNKTQYIWSKWSNELLLLCENSKIFSILLLLAAAAAAAAVVVGNVTRPIRKNNNGNSKISLHFHSSMSDIDKRLLSTFQIATEFMPISNSIGRNFGSVFVLAHWYQVISFAFVGHRHLFFRFVSVRIRFRFLSSSRSSPIYIILNRPNRTWLFWACGHNL